MVCIGKARGEYVVHPLLQERWDPVPVERELAKLLKEKLRPLAAEQQALDEAVSIVIPLVGGYSITCPPLPCAIREMTGLTRDLLYAVLLGTKVTESSSGSAI